MTDKKTGNLRKASRLVMQLGDRRSRWHLSSEPAPLLARELYGARTVLLVDAAVAQRQRTWLATLLRPHGRNRLPLKILPGGEPVKTLAWLERCYEWLARQQLPREGILVAIGGGAVLDLAGFTAATWHRGVRWIAVPTTLLAMVDAAIGGKTAINTAGLKNPAGAFHPVECSLADPAVLTSLPRQQWRNGMAELIKAAVIGSRRLFGDLERSRETLQRRLGSGCASRRVQGIATALPWQDWITQAARVKARIVTADFRDAGPRRALNLGHTLGHVLEAHSGCSHGAAVAVGLATATRLAVSHGLCKPWDGQRVISLLQAIGLPITAPPPPSATLSRMLQGDKKTQGQHPAWVLPARIGKVILDQRIDPDEASAACRG